MTKYFTVGETWNPIALGYSAESPRDAAIKYARDHAPALVFGDTRYEEYIVKEGVVTYKITLRFEYRLHVQEWR